ncbi:extracellular solute-binding protein [uncultured Cohaesibacter sp.]|uniref:extracellular solute-binding protein n=1 Tax=uncultured Cohaesibacter sp. TaxID=1002546 RepID=UPI002930E8FF|nr:extracellular solute-binding protein [uncultured Cohaesibacter sp.]
MTISKTLKVAALTAALALSSTAVFATDYTISVWAGGTGESSHYRVDNIEIAADLMMREAAVRGEELNITVEKKIFSGWDDFKQAFTLAAESGTAPNIAVTGHEDIAPWSQAGLIRPIEDYIDLDAWPVNSIYPNLIEISSFNGQVWGLPQDAESRPFFFYKPHLKAIGYTDEQIDALPEKVLAGEYTLYNALDDAKKMQDAGLVEAGKGFSPRVSNGPDYWQFYVSFGGEILDEETGKLVFNKQAMTDMYQFFSDAVKMGVTSATHLGSDWGQWYNEVANGKAGTWHGGTWHYGRYIKEGQEDFFGNIQFTLIPAGNKNGKANTVTHPLVYLVSSTGDDAVAEVAANLISIASEPRLNTLHAIASSHLGISDAQASIPLYANDRWASEATERLLPHAVSMPNSTEFGAFWNIMFKGLEASWTGQKSVADAVAEVEAEYKSTMADAIIIK